MEWVNPHVWIHIEVPAAGGKVEQWAIEAGTPNVLFRRGFTKEALLPGTAIVVDGYRAKDGSRRANGRDLTLPDGRTLFLGSSGTGAPDGEALGGSRRPLGPGHPIAPAGCRKCRAGTAPPRRPGPSW